MENKEVKEVEAIIPIEVKVKKNIVCPIDPSDESACDSCQ